MIEFVEFDEKFLERSFSWLADPEVKRLTNTPDIDPESQMKWYASLAVDNTYLIWGIKCGNERIGAVGLKHINKENKEAEYFGYIGEKAYWGRGVGMLMVSHIESIAKSIGLNRVYLNVLNYNERAKRLYKKMHYKDVKVNGELVVMEKEI